MDEETVLVVTAMVGLVGIVAQADGDFSEDEQGQLRIELGQITGTTPAGSEAICKTLGRFVREISAVEMPRYCRTLRELADTDLRLQILDMLVARAAADRVVTTTETNVLRQLTSAIGLRQVDYTAAEEKYKARLAVLADPSRSTESV